MIGNKVTIEYVDKNSTKDEIISTIKNIFGTSCLVKIQPESFNPHELLRYVIKEFITPRQATAYFDYTEYQYKKELEKLEQEINLTVLCTLREVIEENEKNFE